MSAARGPRVLAEVSTDASPKLHVWREAPGLPCSSCGASQKELDAALFNGAAEIRVAARVTTRGELRQLIKLLGAFEHDLPEGAPV